MSNLWHLKENEEKWYMIIWKLLWILPLSLILFITSLFVAITYVLIRIYYLDINP